MAEITGVMLREEDPSRQLPCSLCRDATSTRANAPGLGVDVMVPLHVFCAAWIVNAYGRMGRLSARDVRILEEYQGRMLALAAGAVS